ncbi:unnamed protein product [Linum trigynum]|uniref:Uncharacterized protein n=1 Tax=Linum trigynum TaxID=586398 RepID=A0AAV2G4V4_9ROSI
MLATRSRRRRGANPHPPPQGASEHQLPSKSRSGSRFEALEALNDELREHAEVLEEAKKQGTVEAEVTVVETEADAGIVARDASQDKIVSQRQKEVRTDIVKGVASTKGGQKNGAKGQLTKGVERKPSSAGGSTGSKPKGDKVKAPEKDVAKENRNTKTPSKAKNEGKNGRGGSPVTLLHRKPTDSRKVQTVARELDLNVADVDPTAVEREKSCGGASSLRGLTGTTGMEVEQC